MILMIAGPILTLIIVTFLAYREERLTRKEPSFFTSLFAGVLVCTIVFIVLMVVQLIVGKLFARSEKTVFSSREIVGMKDTTGISGSFILASGSFGEDWEYILYERLEDGAFIQRRLPGERVRIYEKEGTIPRIEDHGVVISCDHLPDWVFVFVLCQRSEFKGQDYLIFVPPGSVVTGVELDLNK